jgi:hypothetical protein
MSRRQHPAVWMRIGQSLHEAIIASFGNIDEREGGREGGREIDECPQHFDI